MKSKQKQFIFALLLLVIPFLQGSASTLVPKISGQAGIEQLQNEKTRKPSFFRQIREIKERVKQLDSLPSDEKASSLSRVSMVSFFGSLAAVSLSKFAPALMWVFIIGFVLAMILAAVVLSTEKNRQSRKIAKAVLIGGLTLTLSTIVLAVAIIYLFSQH